MVDRTGERERTIDEISSSQWQAGDNQCGTSSSRGGRAPSGWRFLLAVVTSPPLSGHRWHPPRSPLRCAKHGNPVQAHANRCVVA